jgi:hypothetical protein
VEVQIHHDVSAKQKDFIVLAIGDKNTYGYDKHTLPLLVMLIDLSKPEVRQFTPTSVIAYSPLQLIRCSH